MSTPMYFNLTSGEVDDAGEQQIVEGVVVGGDFGGGEGGTPAWTDITGKPSTFPPTIGTTSTTAVAGNDGRLTAGAAGTATVRAIGTTSTTAAAGDHTHTGLTADQAAGTASVRTLGTGAQQAAAGSHTHTGLTADQAAATASIRTLGTGAAQAAAGNHVHAASAVTATAISPGTATNVQAILAELAARITALESA